MFVFIYLCFFSVVGCTITSLITLIISFITLFTAITRGILAISFAIIIFALLTIPFPFYIPFHLFMAITAINRGILAIPFIIATFLFLRFFSCKLSYSLFMPFFLC